MPISHDFLEFGFNLALNTDHLKWSVTTALTVCVCACTSVRTCVHVVVCVRVFRGRWTPSSVFVDQHLRSVGVVDWKDQCC